MADQEESRSEKIAIAVTPSEKRALELVMAVHADRFEGIGPMLRELSFADAVAEGRRIMARLREESPSLPEVA